MKTAGVPPGIAEEMMAAGGEVTFARFMELALTHPSEGYYSGADVLIGPRGHFSTAPSLSPDFNQSVARLVEELVTAAISARAGEDEGGSTTRSIGPAVNLIELGGGTGELARAVLDRLRERRPDLREGMTYTIVEIGERLKVRQRSRLGPLLKGGWRVAWTSTLTAGLRPSVPLVVVGNEFMDALPVHLVDVRGEKPLEARVAARAPELGDHDEGGGQPVLQLREVWGALSPQTGVELRKLFGNTKASALRSHSGDGFIELRPAVASLFEELSAVDAGACLLTIDYGNWFGADGGRAAYRRTLRGYYRHQPVDDLYARVGHQDLTADVDFRALDLHGRQAGFETVLYTSVADMLKGDAGRERLERLRRRARTSLEADRQATMLERLLDEQGLGGAFRVMLQVRG